MRHFRFVAIAVFAGALAFAGFGATTRIGPLGIHPLFTLGMFARTPSASLSVPVQGVRRNSLRDSWDGPRSGGRRHRGIDIFAKRETEVLSTTPGIVTEVGTNRLGGKIVWVFGPGGEWHYYAHLDRYGKVVPGEKIVAGTILGYVGDTGNAKGTPPHLHYGIYSALGGAKNPYGRLVQPK